jgi:hypothetical protein
MDNNEFFKKVQEECKNMDIYNTDWQKVRIQAAIAAMQGIMTNYEYIKEFHYSSPNVNAMRKDIAKACRIYADALVKELKGE